MSTRENVVIHVEEKADPMVGFVPIYEIVLFKKIGEQIMRLSDRLGFADISDFKNMGFYYELDEAISVMHENRCDIGEHCFNCGFVLVHWPGVYNNNADKNERLFFEWDKEKAGFYEADEPLMFDHFTL